MASQPNNYSTVVKTQNVPFPTKHDAVIVDALDNVQIKDYALAFSKLIESTQIRFLSRMSNNRVCGYVSSKQLADELVDKHQCILINNQKLPIQLVLLSLALVTLSFRRQVYSTPEEIENLPERLQIVYDDTPYWIYLTTDSMTCFICKKDGHVASKFPEKDSTTMQPSMVILTKNTTTVTSKDLITNSQSPENALSEYEPTASSSEKQLNLIEKSHPNEGTEPEHNVATNFKRPHPPTDSSCSNDPIIDISENFAASDLEYMSSVPSPDNDDDTASDFSTEIIGPKKLKKSTQRVISSTDCSIIRDHREKSEKPYPMTSVQLKEFLN
ncbi:hypothetical protein ACJJTC_008240 [Scirpophaga incertulas]